MKTTRELINFLCDWHKENIAIYHPKVYDSFWTRNWAEKIFGIELGDKANKLDSKIWRSKSFVRRLQDLLNFYAKVLKDYRIRQGRAPMEIRDEIECMIGVFIKMTMNLEARDVNNKFGSFTTPIRRVKTEEGYRGRPRTYETFQANSEVKDTYGKIVNRKLGVKGKKAKKVKKTKKAK